MKSAKTIVIVASVVFLILCLGAYSEEQDDAATAKVVPATPPRGARIPVQVIEEEAPSPRPAARTSSRRPTPPPRTTPPRAPSRTTPTRPSARTSPTRPSAITRPTPVRRVRAPEDPHKNSIIQLEAFMVQVRLSALRSLGVPQISEGCNSISAKHIIKLMKTTDAAVVTAGAKVVVGQKNKAETKSTTRRSILSAQRTEYVEVGTQFTAIAEVRRDDKIFVEMEFENSTIKKGDDKTDRGVPAGRDFSSSVLLQDGKPTLVGATQDKETGTFLIVTAHIKD